MFLVSKFCYLNYDKYIKKLFIKLQIVHRGQVANHRPGLSNRSFVHNGRQGFLSCPEMVCPCGLGFSPVSPLPCGAGLGSFNSTPLKYLGLDGSICPKFRKNYFFPETCANMPLTRESDVKNRNFWGFSLGQDVPKTFSGLRWS